MANYLLVYHGGSQPATEAEGAQVMAAWGEWMKEVGEAMVDAGNPIGQSRTIASNGHVSDGGGANPATGYSVLKADSLDAAVELAKSCPHLKSNGSIEVSETFPVM